MRPSSSQPTSALSLKHWNRGWGIPTRSSLPWRSIYVRPLRCRWVQTSSNMSEHWFQGSSQISGIPRQAKTSILKFQPFWYATCDTISRSLFSVHGAVWYKKLYVGIQNSISNFFTYRTSPQNLNTADPASFKFKNRHTSILATVKSQSFAALLDNESFVFLYSCTSVLLRSWLQLHSILFHKMNDFYFKKSLRFQYLSNAMWINIESIVNVLSAVVFNFLQPNIRQVAVAALNVWLEQIGPTGLVSFVEAELFSDALKLENPFLRAEVRTNLKLPMYITCIHHCSG